MHPGALRALEFDRIVAAVRSFALTPTGAARLEALRPDVDVSRVRESLLATTETVRYLADNAIFPLRATDDLPELLDLLTVEGRALEPLRLLTLADYLESVETSAAAVRRASGEFPRLRQVIATAASFRDEIADVRRRIEPSGDVADHASPRLASIRDQLRRKRSKLRETLDGYVRGKDTSKYLQDQIVTERNGRFVLLVKAEHRASLPGPGARQLVERCDALSRAARDGRDQQRCRGARVGRGRGSPAHPARIDGSIPRPRRRTCRAPSAWRRRSTCCRRRPGSRRSPAPLRRRLSTDGRLELLAARHPLLMKGVVSRYTDDLSGLPEVPTPVDIKLVPPDTALLITGPNTGGKTVALKTAGLLPLMAQAGLHVPAEAGSAVPGVPIDLRGHRRRAVDCGQPQHVRLAHHEHRVDGSRPRASGAGAARRNRRRHRSDRRRRARRRHRRSLPHARRAGDWHDALRRAEDLRVEHARRRVGGVCVRSRRLRADVSPDLRIARPQSGARDGQPPWPESADRRSGASGAGHARAAAGDAARAHGSRPRAARRGPEGGGGRARGAVAGEGAGRAARRGAPRARGGVQAQAERSRRRARANGDARDRRRRAGAEAADLGPDES